MDSARELPKLRDGALDLVLCARERLSGARVRLRGFEPERDRQGHEPLLGTVVEISLDPAALGIGGRDDAAARGAHLGELGPDLGRQPLVLEDEPRSRANRFDEPGLFEQRRIVDEHRDLLTRCDQRRRGPFAVAGDLDRPPGRVDVAAVVEAVDELECRVGERPRKAVAHAAAGVQSEARPRALRRGSQVATR